MAARISPHHLEVTRKKIQTSQLINRLQANALGQLEPELSQGQIRSIESLLRKTTPDLQATALDVNMDGELNITINKMLDGPADPHD